MTEVSIFIIDIPPIVIGGTNLCLNILPLSQEPECKEIGGGLTLFYYIMTKPVLNTEYYRLRVNLTLGLAELGVNPNPKCDPTWG